MYMLVKNGSLLHTQTIVWKNQYGFIEFVERPSTPKYVRKK